MSNKINFTHFNSCEEYAGYLRSHILGTPYETSMDGNYNWGGDESSKDATGILEHGNYTKHEDAINAIIDQLRIEGLLTSGVPLPQRHYYGSTANVSAYLRGLPKAMNRRVRAENSSLNAPMRIFMETTISSGVSTSEIVSRGIAMCAFVMAMGMTRPVDLYITSTVFPYNGKRTGICVKVTEKTIDTGRVMFALTAVSYARKLAYNVQNQIMGLNPRTSHDVPTVGDEALFRESLGMSNEDIFITGMHLFDREARTNPIAWVKKMLEKHKTLDHNEAAE